ncbi:class I SAM-dependent methyltransferase [Kribbella sp. NPDC055071]
MATSVRGEKYGDELFSSVRDHEFERLDALSRAFNDASFRHLAAIELPSGARCLDVGAGTGDVVRWLAGHVPAGEVVALDRDPVCLQAEPNLTVLQADVTDSLTDLGKFDLIHSRFVLMHLRDRDEVLERLVSWLRPGGVLVLSDAADLGTASSPHAGYRTTMLGLYAAILATIGSDINQGRRYPGLLVDQGLTDIGLAVDVPVVEANAPIAEFWLQTLRQVRPRIIDAGLADVQSVDDTEAYLVAPDTRDLSIGMLTAWGRKP